MLKIDGFLLNSNSALFFENLELSQGHTNRARYCGRTFSITSNY